MASQLSAEDIDALAIGDGNPRRRIATLVGAVDEGRIAEPADIGYALGVAAELSDLAGDRPGAIELAERAIAANLEHGDGGPDEARAHLAEMLFVDGRELEAFALLEPLQAMMPAYPQAGPMVAEALETAGRSELAVEWLTEALLLSIAAGEALPDEQDEALDLLTEVVYELVTVRHRLRGDLGLEHDEYDVMADDLRAELDSLSHPGPVLFWPAAEFGALVARWPAQVEIWGDSWDAHRAGIEQELQAWSDSGNTGLALLAGSVDGLVAFAGIEGDDPAEEDVQLDYADSLTDEAPWPPARNGPCWCGSGAKYKKCCLPRGRS